jgi:hypothetical protein
VEVEDYDNRAFKDFDNLKTAEGAGVIEIGDFSFYECAGLESVSFPEAVSIGYVSFAECTGLESVNFPAVETIGNAAFYGCLGLESVSFPAVVSIGEGAFYDCDGLESVNLPSAKTIGVSAFYDCRGLESISLPAAESIGNGAFVYSHLTTVSFPASAELPGNPFAGLDSLAITLTGSGPLSLIKNGKALVWNAVKLVSYPSASGELEMPAITGIGAGALSRCHDLESVNFPNATTIGSQAFLDCRYMTSVSLPNAEAIGSNAFSSCGDLESISLPKAETFGESAFSSCKSLKSLSLPAAKTFGIFAFQVTEDTALEITLGQTAPTVGKSLFINVNSPNSVTVKVPSGAIGYGSVPGTYSGSGSTQNWGNAFRGLGWEGNPPAYGDGTGYSTVNENITLTIQQL